MRWRGLAVLAACCLLASPAVGAKKKAPDGLTKLSGEMVALEQKILEKLEADAKAWRAAVPLFEDAVSRQLQVATVERHRLERASLALDLGKSFASREARTAVLLTLAQVDLAIDDLARARMAELQRLEAERAQTLTRLIQLLKRIRTSQKELLAYLEDSSLSKKLGQIDVGLIATAVAEARRVRAALDGAEAAVDFTAEQQRIENRLNEARELLRTLGQLGEAVGGGGGEP